ncbi:hypothetical protein [Alicyclobacillus pomorum]|uniref:hypothetical protein n=1 Tax=Alicyclobacillus pomorum TaxID=204470 RepID=UPI000688CB4C|nr:hypothetical protein [Alicyclobacillus pomorum]
MIPWICVTCGTQFSLSDNPPEVCPICQDERQYVGYQGQHWTTLEDMKAKAYKNAFQAQEPNLIGIVTFPEFGIGQRALLVRTPDGNILWDCITYIDDVTTDLIRGIGGIKRLRYPIRITTLPWLNGPTGLTAPSIYIRTTVNGSCVLVTG